MKQDLREVVGTYLVLNNSPHFYFGAYVFYLQPFSTRDQI